MKACRLQCVIGARIRRLYYLLIYLFISPEHLLSHVILFVFNFVRCSDIRLCHLNHIPLLTN